jgi:hypothetical protein
MRKETRFRYHNSPRPKPRRSGRLFKTKWDRIRSFLKLSVVVLLSPILIPLAILIMPYLFWKARRKGKTNPSPARTPYRPRPRDPELERRRELAKRSNIKKSQFSILYDPIRDDPTYTWAIKEAGRRASEEIGYNQMGDCHRIWRRQKEILKEEFGIEWFTPSEMNPHIIFD